MRQSKQQSLWYSAMHGYPGHYREVTALYESINDELSVTAPKSLRQSDMAVQSMRRTRM